MDYRQAFLVVNLCHSSSLYQMGNGFGYWDRWLKYIKMKNKSPFAHLTHQDLSAIYNATLQACTYALGFAGMTVNALLVSVRR